MAKKRKISKNQTVGRSRKKKAGARPKKAAPAVAKKAATKRQKAPAKPRKPSKATLAAKRRESALKAAATRKRKAAEQAAKSEKRRQAARKAAETRKLRKRDEEAKKRARSEAARKGWQTRRENSARKMRKASRALKQEGAKFHQRTLIDGNDEEFFRYDLEVRFAEKDGDFYAQQMREFAMNVYNRFLNDLDNRVFSLGFVYKVSTRDRKDGAPIWEGGEQYWSTQYRYDFDFVFEKAVSAVGSFGDGEEHESLRRGAYRLWLIALTVRTRKHERRARRERRQQKAQKNFRSRRGRH